MVKGCHPAAFTLALALSATACAPVPQAGRPAAASPAAGVLIIGTADEVVATSVFFLTRRFTLILARTDGQTAAFTHRGCTSYDGLFAGAPCARDRELGWEALELPPGDWHPVALHLDVRSGFPAQDGTLDVALPPGIMIHVGPNEVVYAGDFVFGVDPAARTGSFRAHGRNDDAASHALAAYPKPTNGFVYRDPTATAAHAG